ncbi:MAG: D-alanyl-D-alanine carboxypeptidase [Clostridia bacterium]|nr:D-alanyl-D-alanine carboxypeptidase [Clostridia bacterium]
MLIKKVIVFVLVVTVFAFDVSSVAAPTVSAGSAIVMDADSCNVIFSKNADMTRSMASTTKIMTALLAIESGKLNCTVTAPYDILCDGTAIGIKKGDSFTLETLVWAMLLESGNDAAQLTAIYLAGSQEDFSALMNSKAKEIGMNNTSFVTASGLDDENHYTTAYDMALLASCAVKNPVFRKMCSAETKKVEYISPDVTVTYSNHNKLLKMYDGVFGIKTGFTKKSGRCLVSACEKDGITLVAVTLNAADDWNDHISMYDYSFSVSFSEVLEFEIPAKISVYGGKCSELTIAAEKVNINSFQSENVRCEVYLPEFIYAPVSCGDKIGSVRVYADGKFVSEYSVISLGDTDAYESDNKPRFSFIYKLKYIINNHLKG